MNNQDGKSYDQFSAKRRRKKRIGNIIWAVIILGYLFLIFVSFPQFGGFYIIVLLLLLIIATVIMTFVVLRNEGYSIFSSIVISGITLILGCIILAIVIPQTLSFSREAWENRCKLTLRALGSSQTAFAEKNNGNYGNWLELTDADYIQEGYNRTNMIDNYSITVFEIKKATLCDLAEGTTKSSFTIIAVPRSGRSSVNKYPIYFSPRKDFPGVNVLFRNRPGYHLRTFAICEDQTPRCWIGIDSKWTTENISLRNKELWEPLR
ncbi:hypothetical protein J7L05_00120 [bacterium]|nr:hypothetical protein [bacterium]